MTTSQPDKKNSRLRYAHIASFARYQKSSFEKVCNLNEGIINMMNRFDMDRP